MRRGVSVIVAVVLLIAVSIVAAAGLYFWAGGLATKQPTTSVPIAISATPIDPAHGKILVANLGSVPLTLSSLDTTAGTQCDFGGLVTIMPSSQALCTMPPANGEVILYGSGVDGTATGQAVVYLYGAEAGEEALAGVVFQAAAGPSGAWPVSDFSGGTFSNTSSGSVRLTGPLFTGEWPQYHSVPARTGAASSAGPNEANLNLAPIWTYTAGNHIHSPITVSNGIVYFGAEDSKLYALDADMGTSLWNYTTGGAVYMGAAVYHGTAYFGSNDGILYAVNAATGAQIWNYTVGCAGQLGSGTYGGDTPTVADDVVYIVGAKLYALNAATGAHIWNVTGPACGNRISVSGGRVFAPMLNKIYSFNASTGAQLWVQNYWANAKGAPAAGPNGLVYISVSGNLGVYALNATNGTKMWNYSLAWVSSTAVAGDGKVFVFDGNMNITALNADTGARVWSYSMGNSMEGGAYSNGLVYVAPSCRALRALNASTGALVWQASQSLECDAHAPAVAGGVAYIQSVGQAASTMSAYGFYSNPGTYVSPANDSGSTASNWTGFTWAGDIPAGTALAVYVNVTNTTGSGSWALKANNSALGVGRYLQYKMELNTTAKNKSPRLDSTNVSFAPASMALNYTVSGAPLSWVALNQTCSGVTTMPYNDTASGTSFNKTANVPLGCNFTVWGPNVNATSYP